MEPFDSPDVTKNKKSRNVTSCLVLKKKKKTFFHSVVATLQSVHLKHDFFYINTIKSIVCVTSARYFFKSFCKIKVFHVGFHALQVQEQHGKLLPKQNKSSTRDSLDTVTHNNVLQCSPPCADMWHGQTDVKEGKQYMRTYRSCREKREK